MMKTLPALALVLALTSVAAAQAPPTPTPPPIVPKTPDLKSAMDDHFDAIREIQLGIIHGLMDHVRERATWLASHLVAPKLAVVADEVARVRTEATAIANAPELSEAAYHAARLGAACASCHLAAGATTTFPFEPLPRAARTLPEKMQRHRWAAARMWEGLVGPSNDLWKTGATTLASAPLVEDPRLAKLPETARIRTLARQLRQLARTAASTAPDDASRRAAIYGELLTTCASCHGITWPVVRGR